MRGFTQFDPFEDTESSSLPVVGSWASSVSPNSIRSRILKVDTTLAEGQTRHRSFTQFDPFEDTESLCFRLRPYFRGLFHPIRSVRGY